MKIIIYDATQKGALGLSWKLGAWLYKKLGWCDEACGVTTPAQFFSAIEGLSEGFFIREVQFWGHGRHGEAYVGGGSIRPGLSYSSRKVFERTAADSLFWFRTCSTFGTSDGHDFAKAWASFLDCKAAGHTYKIGFWHSGLRVLEPGQEPDWCEAEGTKGGEALSSSMLAPSTVGFWARSIPEDLCPAIQTEADYSAALKRIEELMDATEPEELRELDRLVALVMRYEEIEYPMQQMPANPDAVVKPKKDL